MTIVPITYKAACEFVKTYHRYHKPPQGHKFSIGLQVGDKLVGVAICGRSVARKLDNGFTLEVTRLCTDGTQNACSKLYSAAWRVAKNMGYRELITYILETETGTSSLKASGWVSVGKAGGGNWNVQSREREDSSNQQLKIKFKIAI